MLILNTTTTKTKTFLLLLLFLLFVSATGTPDSFGTVPYPISPVKVDGNTGRANYGIFVEVPPGTGDTIPSLSINYTQSPKNGILGVGWELSGLHFISRNPLYGINYSPQDQYTSTLSGDLKFSNSDGFYHPKKENFVRFQAIGTCGNGPCEWIAKDKSGLTYYFGNHSSGQVSGRGSSIRLWALSEVRDKFGNGYKITYQKETGAYYPQKIEYNDREILFQYESKFPEESIVSYTFGTAVTESKRLHSIEVRISGNAHKTYNFSYSKSTFGRSLLSSFQKTGLSPVYFTYSNSHLSTTTANTTISGLRLIHQVKNPIVHSVPLSGYSTPWYKSKVGCLAGIEQCKRNQLSVCHPYNPVPPCLSPAAKQEAEDGCELFLNQVKDICMGGEHANHTAWWLLDIDGDGKLDFASLIGEQGLQNFQVQVEQNLTNGLSATNSFVFGSHVNAYVGVADFNGDHKTDLAFANGEYLFVANSDGTNFANPIQTNVLVGVHSPDYFAESDRIPPKIFLGDINGDGLADIVQLVGQTLKVHLAQPNGIFNSQDVSINGIVDRWEQLIDMDGDGRSEFVGIFSSPEESFLKIINFHAIGNQLNSKIIQTPIKPTDGSLPLNPAEPSDINQVLVRNYEGSHWFADVNGDGKTDYIYIEEGGKVTVNLFTGTGFAPGQTTTIPTASFRDPGKKFNSMVDMNGDGMADFISYDGNTVYVALSNGRGFQPNSFQMTVPDFYATVDVNGDGQTDIISIKPDYNTWNGEMTSYVFSLGTGNELLKTISNGYKEITIDYTQKKDISGAINASLNSPQISADSSPEWIVTKVNYKINLTNIYQTYSYQDKRIFNGNQDTRENLGFSIASVTNSLDNTRSITYYENTSGKLDGEIKRLTVFNSAGQIVSDTEIQNSFTVSPWGTIVVKKEKETTNHYKNGNLVFTSSKSYQYDTYGNINKIIDTAGNILITDHTYSAPDLVNWDLAKLEESTTTSSGVIISSQKIHYSGNTIYKMGKKINDSEWAESRFEGYDDTYGNPRYIYDPNGNRTTVEYDSVIHKYPLTINNPKNHTVSTEYDYSNGNVLSKTSQLGAKTIHEYDFLGRLQHVTYPGSTVWNEEYIYEDSGKFQSRVIKRIRESGSSAIITAISYMDEFGKVTRTETTGFGSYVLIEEFVYNPNGTLKQKTIPYLNGVQTPQFILYTYGADGQLITVDFPDGKKVHQEYLGLRTVVTTSKNGKLLEKVTTETTERGLLKSKETQGFSENSSKTFITSYSYDVGGRPVVITEPGGNVTTMQYDLVGRKILHSDKNTGTIKFVYDKLGNLLTQTDSENRTISYAYDNLSRPVLKTTNEGTSTFLYDEENQSGLLTTIFDSSGTTRLNYDSQGRLTKKTKIIDDLIVHFGYRFDALGRLKDAIYPDGTVVHNLYSDSGHLQEVRMDSRDGQVFGSIAVSYGIDPVNNKFFRYTGNNVKTEFGYDPFYKRTTSIKTELGSGQIVTDLQYNYDDKGNTIGIQDGVSPNLSMTYGYDEINRVVFSKRTVGEKQDYSYDDSGNLLQKGTIRYFYDQPGTHLNGVTRAIVTIAGVTNSYHYSYNKTGEMIKRAGSNPTNGDTLSYDTDGNLISIQDGAGNSIASYIYDSSGQRTKKKLSDDSVVYEFDGVFEINIPKGQPQLQTIYVKGYAGENVAQMSDSNATLLTEADMTAKLSQLAGAYPFLQNPIARTFFAIKSFFNSSVMHKTKYLSTTRNSYAYIVEGNTISPKWKLFFIALLMGSLWLYGRKEDKRESFGFATYIPGFTQEPIFVRTGPIFRAITPFLLAAFLTGCVANENSGSTPWSALGLGAVATAGSPTIGGSNTGAATGQGQFSTPGQSSGIVANGAGRPIAGMIFFHPDPSGSPIVLTNTNGEAILGSNGASRIVYNPYGDIDMDFSSGPDIFHKKYQGQDLDSESGMYYFKSRYYDPALGRFITADDRVNQETPMGMDRYMFVEGNPIRYNDPTGHAKAKKWQTNAIKSIMSGIVEAASNLDNSDPRKIFTALSLKNAQNSAKKAERKNQIIKGVVFVIAVVVTVLVSVYLSPQAGAYAASFFKSSFAQVSANFLTQFAVGYTTGKALNEVGGAIAVGINGRSSRKVGEDAASRGGLVGSVLSLGFEEIEEFTKVVDPQYDEIPEMVSQTGPSLETGKKMSRIKSSRSYRLEEGKMITSKASRGLDDFNLNPMDISIEKAWSRSRAHLKDFWGYGVGFTLGHYYMEKGLEKDE